MTFFKMEHLCVVAIKKKLNVSTNFILYKIYLATVFYTQSDDRNCKSEMLLHKETTDFAATSELKTCFLS